MGDEQDALPVSPPIFIPAAVTSPRAERGPWVGTAAGLTIAGLLTTLVLTFATRDGDFQRWTWQPFLPATGWGVLVMALAAVALAVPRGNGRVKAATLGSALLIVAGLLVTATVEHRTRSHIVPRLLAYARGLPVPAGCALLVRQLTAAAGWQGGASPGGGCEFVSSSGRIRVDVSSGVGSAEPVSTALVMISPNDGG